MTSGNSAVDNKKVGGLVLKMSPYRKLVRSIRSEFKWRKETLLLNKSRLEHRLALTLRRAAMCAEHAKRNTIMVQDFDLQLQLENITRKCNDTLEQDMLLALSSNGTADDAVE